MTVDAAIAGYTGVWDSTDALPLLALSQFPESRSGSALACWLKQVARRVLGVVE